MSQLAFLSIFPATPDQVIASRKRSSVQWAKGLTLEQYLHRDASLDVMTHAIDGKLTTWVLAPRDDPTTLNFKCSCETYLRKAFVTQVSGAGPPRSSEITGYGIASVFTPATNRSKGYARYMMRLLHWVMAPHSTLPPFPEAWGAPPMSLGNAKFSALYSDIGDFYSMCGATEKSGEGWVIRSAIGTVWKVEQIGSASVKGTPGEWEWLDIPGVDELWKDDGESMKKDLIESTKSTGRTSFTFLPGDGVATWQIHRNLFTPPLPQLNKWGILLKNPGGTRTYAAWSVDKEASSMTLIIIRLRATQTTFPYLVRKILETAREHGMQKVEVWNLPSELVQTAGELGGKTAERDEHLPAFKWYGDEKAGDVDWLFNEKFCWC